MAKSLKFAGPDNRDQYKCILAKNNLSCKPGMLYSESTVKHYNNHSYYEVNTVVPVKSDLRNGIFVNCDIDKGGQR